MKRRHPTSGGMKKAKLEVSKEHLQVMKESALHKDIIKFIKGIKPSAREFHNCTREGNTQVHCRKADDKTPALCGLFFDRTSSELTVNPLKFIETINESKIMNLFIVVETSDPSQDEWFGDMCTLLQEKLACPLENIFVVLEFSTLCDSVNNDQFLDYVKRTIQPKKYFSRIHYCSANGIWQSLNSSK